MAAGMQEVRELALALPPEERAALANDLWESLDPVDPATEAAWAREVESRLAAFDAGAMAEFPEEEVLRDLDGLLKELGER